jgi:hypothetical protein
MAFGVPATLDLLVDSSASSTTIVTTGGKAHAIPPKGAALLELVLTGQSVEGPLLVNFQHVDVGSLIEERPAGSIEVHAPFVVRWSVQDSSGGGWFPEGMPPKWTSDGRPYFHAQSAVVMAPEGDLTVRATRGLEYSTVEATVRCVAGWYGGDLHIHMNYGGEHVCTPYEAARMQCGEGLHLANLVAGNKTTSRVMDEAALRAWGAIDLPWSNEQHVARMGVEYRNDLLGHFHSLGAEGLPSRFFTGHAASDHPHDWPPNSVAADELRQLGAVIGYCHPSPALSESGPAAEVFDGLARVPYARELVADAALGLVDSVDLISPLDSQGSSILFRRLLGAGVELAATVGTDVFLSQSRAGWASNPPGFGRVYAQMSGPVSVDGFKDAIRKGATVVSNGPWLTISVEGHGPGDRLQLEAGRTLKVQVDVDGVGARQVELRTADGVCRSWATSGDGRLSFEAAVEVREPTYLVAVATGPEHEEIFGPGAFAHTSPVYVDIAGKRVARPEDAEWCVDWLDRLEDLTVAKGRFVDPEQRQEVLDVLSRARAYYQSVIDGKAG